MTNESKSTGLEEELLELTEMADEIYEYLETHENVPERIATIECPALLQVSLFSTFGEEEKAEFITKIVMRKMMEKENDKRNRK